MISDEMMYICMVDVCEFAKLYLEDMLDYKGNKIQLHKHQIEYLKHLIPSDINKRHRAAMMDRQTGKTLLTNIYIAWNAIFNPNSRIIMCFNTYTLGELLRS